MADKKRAKNKDRKHSKKDKAKGDHGEEEFNIEDVIHLGGSKEDYEFLKNVQPDSKSKAVDVDKDLENEIKDMVKSIGLDKIPAQIGEFVKSSAGSDDSEIDSNNDDDDDNGTSKVEEVSVSRLDKKETRTKNKLTQSGDSAKFVEDIYIPTFCEHSETLIEDNTLWHEQIPTVDKAVDRCPVTIVDKIQNVAKRLWENEVAIYQERKSAEKSSDAQWLRKVLTSGTQSDKVAAITMLFQESPVHQVKRLESLLSMSKKRGRREAIMAVDSLRNLLATDILPDRKLKQFWQWPLNKLKDIAKDSGHFGEDKVLILWYFESILKEKYSEFVDSLDRLSHDTIPDVRNKATGAFYELLAMKPELEQKLLTLIVNKLGDPYRKVASRAIYLLSQLVTKHPNMKMIVIEEVERLLYRPNVASKTQYYAICFLNQLIITKKENGIASKLISIYFAFFKVYATKKISETKMLSALLTGVNRAFPYAEGEEETYHEQLNMLFKVCHVDNFQTNVQALMLLFQVMDSRKSVSDRYYRVLYEKLLDHGTKSSSKLAMFLNIIYKSIKADPSMNRIKAFIKRLMQMAAHEESAFICGLLYLISEILKARPGARSLTMQPEEGDDEERFKDVEENSFTAPNEPAADEKQQEIDPNEAETENLKTGWTFRNSELKNTNYGISNRNPLYCGAQFSCAWEIHPLLRHYHPSVSHFARSVLDDKPIEYKGDPLQDFTLVRFLDRFMYKNPKKNPKDRGKSIMQVVSVNTNIHCTPKKVSERLSEQPVNSRSFANKKEENIREDELFFYRYFKQKAEKDASKIEKQGKSILEDEKKSKLMDLISLGEFNYDDMDFSEDEEFDEPMQDGKDDKFTDADYEKALLENLSDSGDELDDDPNSIGTKESNSTNISAMFAAADDFAHLLESGVNARKGDRKQAAWEDRNRSWKKKENKENKKTGLKRKTNDHDNKAKNSNKRIKVNKNKNKKITK
eukprot:gene20332-22332_t